MNKETTKLQTASELLDYARNVEITDILVGIGIAVREMYDDAIDEIDIVRDLNGRDLAHIVDDCLDDFVNIVNDRICNAIESKKRKAQREIAELNEPTDMELLNI